MALARIDQLDDAIGAGIERLVVAHHRRRLKRHGWREAYDPPADGLWCAGEPPPRDGNTVAVLVDGEEALPRLQDEIASARRSVLLAGWAFEPAFRLSRGGPTLRELLAQTAERAQVRVLAWAGAPLPLFTPSRGEVRDGRDALVRGTKIQMALDARERPMHCHHEKLAVIDGRTAYVGGIDLTSLGGDRLDSSEHPARGAIGWHDAAARVTGPLVGDVAAHLALRWRETTGERLEPAVADSPRGDVRAQFVRTVPNGVYDALPRGDFRVLEAYLRALRSAQRFVYLESQFFWAPELVEILVDKLRHPPTPEFRVVIVLPAKPNNGADDTRGQLGVLVDNDPDDRLLACTLFQPGRVEQVYVHAKIGIVDDTWLAIGSANLNGHSFYNDTEACLIACDPSVVRGARLRLWREHLRRDDVDGEPCRVIDEHWRTAAESDDFDRLALLPHVSRRSGAFLGPINGLLVDG
jgi:phosphatidylserine/phosphatidylglycerophosphate/cardiolipin synthase-like enzyme